VISYKMARRSFLRTCGGSAALLVPLLRSIEARAAGAAAPLRFLVIHHPLGSQIDKWRPAGLTASTNTFTLPSISAPFAPLQPKMLMIDGLRIVTASPNNGTAGINTHEGGMVALMTGQPTLGQIGQQDHVAGGASIDQMFLARSPLLGGPNSSKRTPFSSLQLAADIRSDRDEVAPRVLSYLDPIPNQTDLNKARQPLFPETQPLNVFSRIFGGGMPTADVARYIMQKKSVLDFMRSDLARLRTLVPSGETMKLDAQGEAIRQLESSIQVSMGAAGGACLAPDMPPSFMMSGKGASGSSAPAGGASSLSGVDYYVPGALADPTNPDAHPHWKLGMLQLSMIRAAFACDLVRVATFMWSAGTNWVVFPGTFNGQAIMGTPPPQSSPHHPPSHTTDASTMAWLAQIDTWYAQRTSEALQAFESMIDIDSNNLLDNTVVAYVSEVARAYDHDQRNVPFLLFGGKNTRLQTGQFLKINQGPQLGLDGMLSNRPTNDAWLALAPIFGINDMTTLGGPTQYSGPLPGVLNS
jgi:Protein of unknown function (DUF1552)